MPKLITIRFSNHLRKTSLSLIYLACWIAALALAACGETATSAPTTVSGRVIIPVTTGVNATAPVSTPTVSSPSASIASTTSSTTASNTPVLSTAPVNGGTVGLVNTPTAAFLPTATANSVIVTAPTQAATGPGGKDYPYSAVRANRYRLNELGYYLYEPEVANITTLKLPLVVLLHGYAGVDPTSYRPWINHIVKKGNIVIFPVYQRIVDRDGTKFTDNAILDIKAALTELASGRHAQPDLERYIVIGFSAGGIIGVNIVARSAKVGLPQPKGYFGVTPGGCANCSIVAVDNFRLAEPDELAQIPASTYFLLLAGDRDIVVAQTGTTLIWQSVGHIAAERRSYLYATSDNHGLPPLRADHGMANRVPPDVYNFYGIWKLTDAMQSCAFENKNCNYAFGGTPEQKFLGIWSDGVPVTELKLIN